MGAPEALGEDLNVEWHSPDFFPMRGVAERVAPTGRRRSRVSRLLSFGRPGTQPAQVPERDLPLLQTGRRFGTEPEPTRAEGAFHVILSPSEAAGLRDEWVLMSCHF